MHVCSVYICRTRVPRALHAVSSLFCAASAMIPFFFFFLSHSVHVQLCFSKLVLVFFLFSCTAGEMDVLWAPRGWGNNEGVDDNLLLMHELHFSDV